MPSSDALEECSWATGGAFFWKESDFRARSRCCLEGLDGGPAVEAPSSAFFALRADGFVGGLCRRFLAGEASLAESSMVIKSFPSVVLVVAAEAGVAGVLVAGVVADLCSGGWLRTMRRSNCRSRRLVSCSKKVRRQVVRMARTRDELTADLEIISLTELVAAKMSRLMLSSLAATRQRDFVMRRASAIRWPMVMWLAMGSNFRAISRAMSQPRGDGRGKKRCPMSTVGGSTSPGETGDAGGGRVYWKEVSRGLVESPSTGLFPSVVCRWFWCVLGVSDTGVVVFRVEFF